MAKPHLSKNPRARLSSRSVGGMDQNRERRKKESKEGGGERERERRERDLERERKLPDKQTAAPQLLITPRFRFQTL